MGIEDGHVQLLFLVPGLGETLRVSGVARLDYDASVCVPLAEGGVVPKCVLEIHITSVYLQCAKAIIRSQLWNPDKLLPKEKQPSPAHMLAEQTGLKSAEEMELFLCEA